jgi:hypothetical protein
MATLLDGAASVLRDEAIIGEPADLVADLPRLPAEWSWKEAADAVQEDSPIVYGIVQPGPAQEVGTGVPYVRGQDIRDNEIVVDDLPWAATEVASKYARSALKSGDVVVSIIRYMRSATVPDDLEGANLSRGAARLRPNDQVDASFLVTGQVPGVG